MCACLAAGLATRLPPGKTHSSARRGPSHQVVACQASTAPVAMQPEMLTRACETRMMMTAAAAAPRAEAPLLSPPLDLGEALFVPAAAPRAMAPVPKTTAQDLFSVAAAVPAAAAAAQAEQQGEP